MKRNHNPLSHKHAFTIVELLIVIVVIAVLAAIVIVSYNGITNQAHSATVQESLGGVNKSFNLYYTQNQSYPTQLTDVPSLNPTNLVYGGGVLTSAVNGFCVQYNDSVVGSYFTSYNNPSAVAGTCHGAFGCAKGQYCVTTLAGGNYAGTSARGSTDATGLDALFYSPESADVDSSGNIYIADKINNEIRKITPSGVVTTVAGAAMSAGFVDATGSSARFNHPQNVAVDTSGNLYVLDQANNAVRKIVLSSGAVSTFAGSNSGASGYVDSTGTSARFSGPTGLALDSSGTYLYVLDGWANACRLRKIVVATQTVSTLAGGACGFVDGTGAAAKLGASRGIAVDGSGNIWVADGDNCAVREVTPAGVVSTVAGGPSGGSKNCGVADGNGNSARFSNVFDIAYDPSSGNMFVADTTGQTIRKITSSGAVTTIAGVPLSLGYNDGTASQAVFSDPHGLAIDSSGVIYVMDTDNGDIRKITMEP